MDNLIEISWRELKSSMAAKAIQHRLQWVQSDSFYSTYLFDGPMQLTAKIPITTPPNAEQFEFETKYKTSSNKVLSPIDAENATLSRTKITQVGWAFQVHAVGIETGKLTGISNRKIDPVTLQISDLGFATIKLYDENRVLITDPLNESQAKYTVVDWAVNHEMEIIGGIMTQNARPTNDIWLWIVAAPQIANIFFSNGGINLKRLGDGNQINADGRAAKYLHPTQPIPGVNKFRMIFYHPTYEVHPCQVLFTFFKP